MMTGGQSAVSGKLRSRKGQSLIIALSVMFILVFLGTVFVTLVARNLTSAVRSGDVLIARQLAEAGINYANRMLTYSDDGADWRPEPANLDKAANANHPDIEWLQPYEPADSATGGPSGGFTSFTGTNADTCCASATIRTRPTRHPALSRSRRSGGRGSWIPTSLARGPLIPPRTPTRACAAAPRVDGVQAHRNHRLLQVRDQPLETLRCLLIRKAFGPKPIIFGGTVIGQERTGPLRVNGNLVWRGKERSAPAQCERCHGRTHPDRPR